MRVTTHIKSFCMHACSPLGVCEHFQPGTLSTTMQVNANILVYALNVNNVTSILCSPACHAWPRGVERLACYAFACPSCMDEALAAQCKGFVLSVAFRDDVVTRFSPQSLAALNTELREFDLEAAKKVRVRHSEAAWHAGHRVFVEVRRKGVACTTCLRLDGWLQAAQMSAG